MGYNYFLCSRNNVMITECPVMAIKEMVGERCDNLMCSFLLLGNALTVLNGCHT